MKTIVDICVGVGIVGLGSVVVPVAFEKGTDFMMVFGLAVSIGFWYIAIRLSEEIV